MTSSHDSPHLRPAALGATVALPALCWFIACATVVEEPSATSDVGGNTDFGSNTGGATSTTNSATLTVHTASMNATSVASTGTPNTTSSVATTAEAATSTSSSASNTTTATTVTTATVTTSSVAVATTATSSSAGGAGGTTTGSFVTTVTDGAGGTTASATNVTTSTTGTNTEYCDDPLTPAENVGTEGTTGAFDTTDGVCYRLDFVPAAFAGWGCSNFQAGGGNRTIVVNGTTVTCGELPLPEPVAGGYYFDFGPGTNVSAAMYWWNWE